MFKKAYLIILISILLSSHCRRDKEPLGPKTLKPNSISSIKPQVDIPWPSLANSPWPMHHHDPQSTGRSPYVGPQQGRLVWKYKVNGPVGSSVAIGPDSTIYFASSYDTTDGFQDSFLYALRGNGSLKWRFKLISSGEFGPASQACSPLVAADGTVYIGSTDHLFYAVKPNGTLKWTFKANAAINSISASIGLDGTVYFTAADNCLYAVNPDGTLRWKSGESHKFLCSGLAGISVSPDGSTLYLGYVGTAASDASSGLAAVTLDGRVKWAFKAGSVDCTPLVDNEGNIFFGAGGMFSVTPEGQLRWKYPGGMNNKDAAMDYDGNVYFSVGPTGTQDLLVSMTNGGTLRWKMNITEIGPLTSSLICDREGTVYGSAWFPVRAYAFMSNGQLKWQSSIGKVNGNSPALVEGLLFVGTWFVEPGKEFYCIK